MLLFTSVFSLLFVVLAVPEGKGRSLEDVQQEQEACHRGHTERQLPLQRAGGTGSSLERDGTSDCSAGPAVATK